MFIYRGTEDILKVLGYDKSIYLISLKKSGVNFSRVKILVGEKN